MHRSPWFQGRVLVVAAAALGCAAAAMAQTPAQIEAAPALFSQRNGLPPFQLEPARRVHDSVCVHDHRFDIG